MMHNISTCILVLCMLIPLPLLTQIEQESVWTDIAVAWEGGTRADSVWIAQQYGMLGKEALFNWDYDMAIQYGLEAKTLYEALGEPSALSNILSLLGNAYISNKDMDSSANMFFAALDLLDASNSQMQYAQVYAGLSQVYKTAEDYPLAIQYLDQAREIIQSLGDTRRTAMIYANQANLFFAMKEVDQALISLDSAMQYFEQMNDQESLTLTYQSKGSFLSAIDRNTEALSFFQMALANATVLGDTVGMGMAYHGIGNELMEQGRFAEAFQHHQQSRDLLAKTGHELDHISANTHMGLVHFGLGEFAESYDYTQKSIELYERLFQQRSGKASKQAMMRQSVDAYDVAIQSAIEVGKTEEAFLLSEGEKSRFLNILQTDATQRKAMSEEKYRSVVDNLRTIGLQLSESNSGPERLELIRQKKRLIQQLTFLQSESRDIPGSQTSPDSSIASIADIQTALTSTETLIEFFLGKTKAYAFVLDKSRLKVLSLGASEEIRQAIHEFQTEYVLRTKHALKNKADRPEARRNFFSTSSTLFNLLIAPLDSSGFLHKKKDLILIPDGELYYLPFELLIRDKQMLAFHQYHYLVQDYSIRYYPAGHVLWNQIERQQTRHFSKKLLAFGSPVFSTKSTSSAFRSVLDTYQESLEPLPYAREELEGIVAQFPTEEADVFMDNAATEHRLKSLDLGVYQYCHFSTHGLMDPEMSEFSALLFGRDSLQQEDGRFEVYELFESKISADLVSLSACETGLGKLSTGEGMEGFSQVLLAAGVSRLIVSLWLVRDRSTSIFFQTFYRNLSKSSSGQIYSSFRKTQLDWIKHHKHNDKADPYFWAPFILIGKA